MLALDLDQCILKASQYYNVNPYVLKAIAKVESNFNPRAINRNKNGTTDHGIFQINSTNLKRLNIPTYAAHHECYSAYLGAYILRECMNVHGNTWKAIDCYNKGPKRAKTNSDYVWRVYRVLKSWGVY